MKAKVRVIAAAVRSKKKMVKCNGSRTTYFVREVD